MQVRLELVVFTAGVASAILLASRSAEAQWGGRSYFHAPPGGPPEYTNWPSRASLYGTRYGAAHASPYAMPYSPSFTAQAPVLPLSATPYGTMPYGTTYGNPRGRLKYDVYTPYGKQEHEYKFRRNGRIDFDIDD